MNPFKNWQGLLSLVVAVGVFWIAPLALRMLDPTAGAFDAGYLQRPVLALVYMAFGHFVAWAFLQLDWPTIDKWIDAGGFRTAWDNQVSRSRIFILGSILVLELTLYVACLFAVPV
jgi:hypothetical protein